MDPLYNVAFDVSISILGVYFLDNSPVTSRLLLSIAWTVAAGRLESVVENIFTSGDLLARSAVEG